MTEEGKITMSEFKTVVERFEENQKKIVDVMQHEFGKIQHQFGDVQHQFGTVQHALGTMNGKIGNLQEQVALLHEGQTAIRTELRQKPSFDVIEELERRVTRLENKVA